MLQLSFRPHTLTHLNSHVLQLPSPPLFFLSVSHPIFFSFSTTQWFVGLWWKHLAGASLSDFSESLSHFATWASSEHGLECVLSWLERAQKLKEDVVLLQLLEVREYNP